MEINDFNYNLDKRLIAQHPPKDRSSSKMMVLNRKNETIAHSYFNQITHYISNEYLIVINDSKVFPARLFGKDENNNQYELLLTKEKDLGVWEAMIHPLKKLKSTKIIYFEDNIHKAYIKLNKDYSRPTLNFSPKDDFWDFIYKYGKPPLPPYIKRKINEYSSLDTERYQTIYAEKIGSIAAPTAGFHFTQETINNLITKGIEFVKITLHVGPATFTPIRTSSILNHKMEPEYIEITLDSFYKIKNAKKYNMKILAIGTTTTRALESISFERDIDNDIKTSTDLFIYPGYKFKTVDALLTNFHLPKSTLLLLVCAFSSKNFIFKAYQEAIANEYKFYSFGDCMLIL